MMHRQCRGNTIAEYALLIGLVLVGCLGSLSILGRAIFGLNVSVASHIASLTSGRPTLQANASSNKSFWFLGQGNPQALKSMAVSSMSRAAYNDKAQSSSLNVEAQSMELPPAATNGGSGNITGSNGDDMSLDNLYAQTIAAALKMEDMAAKVTDLNLKEWFENAAQNTMRLAKNQAALAYNLDSSKKTNTELVAFVGESNISQAMALNSLASWQQSLQEQKDNLLNSGSIGQTALAQSGISLVNNVLKLQDSQYAGMMSPSNSSAGIYNPNTDNIKQDAIKAINAGIATDSVALHTSLEGSVALKTQADSLP